MSQIPDCVLLAVDEASALLQDAEVAYAVTDISPSNKTCRYDQSRVVRQALDAEGILQLTVADFVSRPLEPVGALTLEQAPASGVYVLELRLGRGSKIKVGALGKVKVRAGTYLYVGSAKTGLRHRLTRHFSKDKVPTWHIDYLTMHFQPLRAVVWPWEVGLECATAGLIGRIGTPVPGFGCSDCSCEAHLIRLRKPSRLWWAEVPGLAPPICTVE